MDIQRDSEELDGGSSGIRPVDQKVLELLRREPGMTVPELIERLGVTATAVRQRLDRLVDMRMLERRKQSVGRGRPTFKHFLTPLGWREVGATYADLATAMWQEICQIDDLAIRETFLKSISQRMGKAYGDQIPPGPLQERLESLVQLLSDRKIPATVENEGASPTLEVHACPYPELADGEATRKLCELEKRVLTEALGEAMELSRCRLDGHGCCQFRPVQLTRNSEVDPNQNNS